MSFLAFLLAAGLIALLSFLVGLIVGDHLAQTPLPYQPKHGPNPNNNIRILDEADPFCDHGYFSECDYCQAEQK